MLISATAQMRSATWMTMAAYADLGRRKSARAAVVNSLAEGLKSLAEGTNGSLSAMQEEMANLQLLDPTLDVKETRRVTLTGSRSHVKTAEINDGQEELLREAQSGKSDRVSFRKAKKFAEAEIETEVVPAVRPDRPVNTKEDAFVAMCAKCNEVIRESAAGPDLAATCSGPC